MDQMLAILSTIGGDNRGAEHVFYASVHVGVLVCVCVRARIN